MTEAPVTRSPSRSPDYVSSPDMAAFTIGQIVIALLAEDGDVSVETVRRQLIRIAMGHASALDGRVNAEMALGALYQIETRLLADTAKPQSENRGRSWHSDDTGGCNGSQE